MKPQTTLVNGALGKKALLVGIRELLEKDPKDFVVAPGTQGTWVVEFYSPKPNANTKIHVSLILSALPKRSRLIDENGNPVFPSTLLEKYILTVIVTGLPDIQGSFQATVEYSPNEAYFKGTVEVLAAEIIKLVGQKRAGVGIKKPSHMIIPDDLSQALSIQEAFEQLEGES